MAKQSKVISIPNGKPRYGVHLRGDTALGPGGRAGAGRACRTGFQLSIPNGKVGKAPTFCRPSEESIVSNLTKSRAKTLEARLVARAVGAKQVRMAPQREVEHLTGLKVGGISPLALLDKPFEIYLDASATGLDELYINGGQRGINLRLRVADLLAVTGATIIQATANQPQADEAEA